MRATFWRNCSRVAAVVFPLSALALVCTPHESEWELPLSATAVASGGTWLAARPRRLRERPPRRR